MKTHILLIISLVANVWLSFSIIRLEKFHYSTKIGICSQQKFIDKQILREYDETKMYDCLSKSEPRTSDWWNLLYGLKIL
jgi:hypothetical protein